MVAAAPALHAAIETPTDRPVLFAPFPGFQTEACAAGEDEVFLGGAKGPGKTQLVIALATRQVQYSAYKAWLFRSTYKEVQELIDRSHQLYPKMPERPAWNGELKRWNFPSGAFIAMSYCEDEKDAEQVQGKEPCFLGWDEFGKAKIPRAYELMLGELRSKDKRIRCQFVTTGNPGQRNHGYIKKRFITPCGESGGRVFYKFTLPNGLVAYKSRRWVRGTVWDNPIYANDPSYIAQLMSMNERDRKYLLEGSWDNPDGLAFNELDARIHFVRPFRVPAHWPMWAGHDWGFAHPWVFVQIASDEDGKLWVVDTIWGRRNKDSDIAQRIKARAPLDRINPVYAGTDVFAKHRARIEESDAESTAERYLKYGLQVVNANTDRALGARTVRELIAWRGNGPHGTDTEPQLRFMDTPGNRRLFDQLEALVTDPDDPEDVLKVDADESGEGGDDGYDGFRYAVHSRPRIARETWLTDRAWSINDPDVLRAETIAKKTAVFGKDRKVKRSAFNAYA